MSPKEIDQIPEGEQSGNPTSHRFRHLHFDEVLSTMETARQTVQEAKDGTYILVTAERQTAGRGTRGRPWHSPRGNIYLTLAIPRSDLSPTRLGLFPLEAGLALWEAAATLLPPTTRTNLRLKWPNDLLWEGRKAAGMLLEATSDHLFVGVGVNLTHAPLIEDGGTPSAALSEAGLDDASGLVLATSFARILRERLRTPRGQANGSDTLDEWRSRALWDKPLRLRDRIARPEVFPVDLNAEGHLRVRFADGHEEWLVSEYLA